MCDEKQELYEQQWS